MPGDEIIGYITRGRGVTVHKADCINMIHAEPERMVEVSWNSAAESKFSAGIRIVAYYHEGLLGDLAVLIASMDAPIESVTAKAHKDGTATITLQVQTQSRAQLDKMIRSLQKRADIIEVFRLST